ncbi:MAG: hypothetical protein R3Y09_10070 [Clostridia bacterium]
MTLNGQLIEMANVDIDEICNDEIFDLDNVDINSDTLLEDCIIDGKNPYFIKCEGVVVKMRFSDTDITIEDRLKGYIDSLY